MTWLLSLLIGLLVVLLITVATGYFVAQEFAYMAVDRSRLAARSVTGDRAADRALSITRRTSFMLSGAQLGITVTGLLVGYVAEPLIGTAVGEALGGTSIPTGTGVVIGTVLALVVATLIQMLFGELFPKNLAIARPEALAIWLARSTAIYLAVFGWLITIFDKSSNVLLKVLGIEPVHDVDHAATRRDLKHIVADSRQSGDLVDEDSLILDRILDFPQQSVDHATVPRSRVDVVHDDMRLHEIRNLMRTGHSRYPVLDAGEQVVGTIDLLDVLTANDDDDLRPLLKTPIFVPESLPLPDAVRTLTESRAQMGCVVDEYGGFSGIITLEDLGEELVGDIVDEHDEAIEEIVATADDTWTAPGSIPLDELARVLQRELPATSAHTLSGLIIEQAKGFPEVGERVEISLPVDPAEFAGTEAPNRVRLNVDVLEVRSHVPSRLQIGIEVQR
ncbi:hemolysin family protein [Brevibacterium picturae]|uniref:Hemolysin family protein n=1 Tax=Brevibacterium picturae TaxID=260553 RepID=A0ABP4N8T5_9MICO